MDQSYLYTKDKNEVTLTDDVPINGQTWACLSFVSPENVIKDKDGFTVAKFLQSYAASKDEDFEKLYNDYVDFKYKHADSIDADFSKDNKNVTHIRGVKVRGVYSTQEDARTRAEILHKQDPSFNVFIGTVGQWLPWDPTGDKINDEVFLDESLNTLVSEYKKQSNNRDKVFHERMDDVRNKEPEPDPEQTEFNINSDNLKLQEKDPWIASKTDDPIPEEDPTSEVPTPEKTDDVVSDMVDSLNNSNSSDSVETLQ